MILMTDSQFIISPLAIVTTDDLPLLRFPKGIELKVLKIAVGVVGLVGNYLQFLPQDNER